MYSVGILFLGCVYFFTPFVFNFSSGYISINPKVSNIGIGVASGNSSFKSVEEGDIIISIDGNPYASETGSVWGVVSGIDYALLKDSSNNIYSVTLKEDPQKNLYLLHVFISALLLMFASYTYIRKSYIKEALVFYILCSSMAFTIISITPSQMGLPYAHVIGVVSILLTSHCLVHFFTTYPTQIRKVLKSKLLHISYFFIGSSLIFLLLIYFTKFSPIRVIIEGLVIGHFLFAGTTSIFLLIMYQRFTSAVETKIYYIISCLLIGFVPVILFVIIPIMMNWKSINSELTIPFILVLPITLSLLLMNKGLSIYIKEIITTVHYVVSIFLTLTLMYLLSFSMKHKIGSIENLSGRTYETIIIISSIVLFIFSYKFIKYLHNKLLPDVFSISPPSPVLSNVIKGEHALHIGRTICNLIHSIARVNGVCLVWRDRETQKILHSTGVLHGKDILTLNIEKKDKDSDLRYTSFVLRDFETELGVLYLAKYSSEPPLKPKELKIIRSFIKDIVELLRSVRNLKYTQEHSNSFQFSKSSQSFKKISDLLIKTKEDEKKELSNWLHDGVLQNLIFISNDIKLSQKNNHELNLVHLNQQIVETISMIRKMCNELHPIMVDDFGLKASIKSFLNKLNPPTTELSFVFEGNCHELTSYVRVHVFRVIRELIINAIKHAQASKVSLYVEISSNTIHVKLSDNGVGFQVPKEITELLHKKSMGLFTTYKQIEELNGNLEIYSTINEGTTIYFEVPIEGENANEENKYRIS